MMMQPAYARFTARDLLRESFAPVLIFSLIFHGLFFAGIILITKALYKSKEFERPYTFELIRLSQVLTTSAQPAIPLPTKARASAKKANPPAPVAEPVAVPVMHAAETKPVPEETRNAPPSPKAASVPAAASPSVQSTAHAGTGPIADQAVSTDKVYEGTAVDEQPMRVKTVDPFYPEFVKDQGISGVVKAQVIIDQNGNVMEIKILSSPHELLSDEVYKAVSRWKYRPARFKGVAVRVINRDVRIEFKLTE
jgi:periplasmic protein TonB